MDIIELLIELENFEELMRRVYTDYASRFGEHSAAGAFFLRLSREEAGHRDTIRQMRGLASRHLLLGDIETSLQAGAVREAIRMVTDRVLGTPGDDLSEMLVRAYWAEQFAMEKHTGLLLAKVPPLAKMQEVIRQGDQDHTEAIREFAREQKINLNFP